MDLQGVTDGMLWTSREQRRTVRLSRRPLRPVPHGCNWNAGNHLASLSNGSADTLVESFREQPPGNAPLGVAHIVASSP